MGEQLTANFRRHEFRCLGKSCCHFSAPIDMVLVNGLQMMHDILEEMVGYEIKMFVSSGFRCQKHNEEIGSQSFSQHPRARAADIWTPGGVTDRQLIEAALRVPQFKDGGIGLYDWGIHVDVRGHKARFDKRTDKRGYKWENEDD